MTTLAHDIQRRLDADLRLIDQDIATLDQALEEAHEQVVHDTLAHSVVSDKTQAALQHETEIRNRLKGQRSLRPMLLRTAREALQRRLIDLAKSRGLPEAMGEDLYVATYDPAQSLEDTEVRFTMTLRLVIMAYLAGQGDTPVPQMEGANPARAKSAFEAQA